MALNGCPPDPEDAAERYVLRRMPPDEAAAFERHCMTCAACGAMLAREREIASVMRAVGPMLARKPDATHD